MTQSVISFIGGLGLPSTTGFLCKTPDTNGRTGWKSDLLLSKVSPTEALSLYLEPCQFVTSGEYYQRSTSRACTHSVLRTVKGSWAVVASPQMNYKPVTHQKPYRNVLHIVYTRYVRRVLLSRLSFFRIPAVDLNVTDTLLSSSNVLTSAICAEEISSFSFCSCIYKNCHHLIPSNYVLLL
jgi:hypothetical protein